MQREPDVVPEEGRQADGEENGDEEKEDDMILGDPQRGGVQPEVDEVLEGGEDDEGTVEQSVEQEQHEELKRRCIGTSMIMFNNQWFGYEPSFIGFEFRLRLFRSIRIWILSNCGPYLFRFRFRSDSNLNFPIGDYCD